MGGLTACPSLVIVLQWSTSRLSKCDGITTVASTVKRKEEQVRIDLAQFKNGESSERRKQQSPARQEVQLSPEERRIHDSLPVFSHLPVLLDECLEALQLKPEGIYVDCTAGGAGHSAEILRRLGKGGRLLAFDKDPDARRVAQHRLSKIKTEASFELVAQDFSALQEVLTERGIVAVDGILADLGVSSYQLDTGERGFAYRLDGPLDMRMNPLQGRPASAWLAEESEERLAQIFRDYGEERYAKSIARQLVRYREQEGQPPLLRTEQLVEQIFKALPAAARREKQHPAKRVFQALRIAVNGELDSLAQLLAQAPFCLKAGGRLAIISFHSLEDRLVKQAYRQWEHPCECPRNLPCVCGKKSLGRAVPRKGITARPEELGLNPRSRSAVLRVFEKALEESL